MAGFVLVALALIVLFAPLWECPICRMWFEVDRASKTAPSGIYILGEGCEQCWRGRLSAYRRWWDPHSPFPGSRITR